MVTLTEDTVSVHRLVQAVTKNMLSGESKREAQAMSAALMEAALPEEADQLNTWPRFAKLLAHSRMVLPA